MSVKISVPGLSNWLPSIPRGSALLDAVSILANLVEARSLLTRVWDRLHYHGMYEIVEYDSTLEIMDAKGQMAILSRREVIRFLQNNVVAIHDHAWGDGDIFAEYRCQPGAPVDFYQDGSQHNVLVSLRETRNRGDVVDFWVERTIRRGLLQEIEWLETDIDHWTKHLKLAVIFPKERPCKRATLSSKRSGQTIVLSPQHFALLPDGRQKLTWETQRPNLYDLYTIQWMW